MQSPLTTHDFGLATYLVMKGAQLLGSVNIDGSNRLALVFVYDDNCRKYETEWLDNVGDAVPTRAFNKATRRVRDALRTPYKEGL